MAGGICIAKFYGAVGYGFTEETKPGVWMPRIVERKYSGDMIRNTRQAQQSSDSTNDNVNINNQVSILADPFAYENFHAMKYVEHMGTKWKVSAVEVQYPRLILTVGGVYNGEG